jgi:hypothetical protein
MAGAVPLSSTRVIELEPTPPFHFDSTLHKPDHFPSADNEWQPGVRWQTMRFDDHALGLKFEDLGSVNAPRIRLSVSSAAELSEASFARLLDEIEYRTNLKLDLTAFYRRFAEDPQLKPIIKRWRGMRPLNHSSLYEYLIIAIVLQNTTVRRTVQMMQALFETHVRRRRSRATPGSPTHETVETLRRIGTCGYLPRLASRTRPAGRRPTWRRQCSHHRSWLCSECAAPSSAVLPHRIHPLRVGDPLERVLAPILEAHARAREIAVQDRRAAAASRMGDSNAVRRACVTDLRICHGRIITHRPAPVAKRSRHHRALTHACIQHSRPIRPSPPLRRAWPKAC